MADEDDDLELGDDLHEEELEQAEGNEDQDGEGQDAAAAGQDEQQAAGDEGAAGQVREEPRVSRGERRFQTLANSVKEANERAARLERELQQEKQARQQREAQQQKKEPTPEEMALWTTDQIVDYKLGKATGNFQQTLQQIQFQTMDANDKSAFTSLCATDPRAKKYAGEVETRLAELRAQGQNVPREALLKFVIGEKIMQNAGKAVSRQRQKGQENIRRQQSSASAPRSDASSGRQAKTEAEKRRERLENMTF